MTENDKINLFMSIFRGRDDCYGNEAKCINEPLDRALYRLHLIGKKRIGVYMVLKDSIYFSALDIDRDDIEAVKEYYNNAISYGLTPYIEISKSKGYHVWHFFSEPVKASKIRAIMKQIADVSNIGKVEIFPKQDIVVDGEFGNFINLPLYRFDALNQKTVFIDTSDWQPLIQEGNWQLLSSIHKITPDEVDDIIEINNISFNPEPEKQTRTILTVESSPEGDINKVIEKCLFIQHCISNAETLPEELWYAMICNLATLPGGRDKIHEFSKLDSKRYTYKNTEEKIEHALKDAPAPTTCKKIIKDGFICERQCSVKAPAGLAYKHDIGGIESFPQTEQKLFNQYISLFGGVTEAPDSYHFFSFAVAMGMMLERKVYISYPHEVYPNLFAILVGRSGHDRKDTSIKFGKKTSQQVSKAQILPSVNSYEGLIQAMLKPELALASDNTEYNHVLLALSEFNSLLKKARNDSISNLIPQLCELYDTPAEARLVTRGNPIKVDNPFVSIIAGIQPSILQKAYQSGDIDSGFSGRFMYVYDRAKEPIPFPEAVNQELMDGIISKAKKGLQQLVNANGNNTKLELTPEARTLWNDFYHWHRDSNKESELLSTLTVRIPEQVLKLAMIFSAVGGYFNIDEFNLRDAIKVGRWCMHNTEVLFEGYGQTKVEKTESNILRMIKDKPLTRRTLQQLSHVDAETFGRAVDNLLKAELVEDKKDGRKKLLKLTED